MADARRIGKSLLLFVSLATRQLRVYVVCARSLIFPIT